MTQEHEEIITKVNEHTGYDFAQKQVRFCDCASILMSAVTLAACAAIWLFHLYETALHLARLGALVAGATTIAWTISGQVWRRRRDEAFERGQSLIRQAIDKKQRKGS